MRALSILSNIPRNPHFGCFLVLHAELIILLTFVCGQDIIQILYNLSFYVITHILESSKI